MKHRPVEAGADRRALLPVQAGARGDSECRRAEARGGRARGRTRRGRACGWASARAPPRAISWTSSAQRVREGLRVVGVPTSRRHAPPGARTSASPLTTLDETPELDLTVDGADEIDRSPPADQGRRRRASAREDRRLASRRMVVIADESKQVADARPLPASLEVVAFGLGATRLAVAGAVTAAGCAGDWCCAERDGAGSSPIAATSSSTPLWAYRDPERARRAARRRPRGRGARTFHRHRRQRPSWPRPRA